MCFLCPMVSTFSNLPFLSFLLGGWVALAPMTLSAAERPSAQVLGYFQAYSSLDTRNIWGGIEIHREVYGTRRSESRTEGMNKFFTDFFNDTNNVAAILIDQGTIVGERYREGFDPSTPLFGASMAKTVLSSVVGTVVCTKGIESLDDSLGKYAKDLRGTPWEDITFKNALQMRSGMAIDRGDEDTVAQKAKGIRAYKDIGDAVTALRHYSAAHSEQGTRFNYHVADSLALSLAIERATGRTVGKIFYEEILSKASDDPYLIWMTDRSGTTLAFGELVMPARSWAQFGRFLLDEINSGSCLGRYLTEGIDTAGVTDFGYKKYGYHFWVYPASNRNFMVIHGAFGNLMIVDVLRGKVLLMNSIGMALGAYNVHRDAIKIYEDLIRVIK